MNTLKQDMDRLQNLVMDAARQVGVLTALADGGMSAEKLQRTLEQTSGQFERSALEVRKLCKKHSPGVGGYGSWPGSAEIAFAPEAAQRQFRHSQE